MALGRRSGIRFSNIQYYWLDVEGKRLISANSLEHASDLIEQMQLREFDRSTNMSPLHASDSFWSFALQRPVIVRVDSKSSSPPLREVAGPGGIPLLIINEEPCQFLKDHKGSVWVDFPLKVGEKWIGKFSCDYSGNLDDNSKSFNDVSGFWRFVQSSSAYAAEVPLLARSARAHHRGANGAQRCDSLEELYRYCVDQLPQLFGGGAASLYTLIEDDGGSAALVFSKTTESKRQGREDLESYQFADLHFVPWIARERLCIVTSSPAGIPETDQLPASQTLDGAILQTLGNEFPNATLIAASILASTGAGKSMVST